MPQQINLFTKVKTSYVDEGIKQLKNNILIQKTIKEYMKDLLSKFCLQSLKVKLIKKNTSKNYEYKLEIENNVSDNTYHFRILFTEK